VPCEQERCSLEFGPEKAHLASVEVGRSRLGVEIVAVVPADDEAEVVNRGEHRAAGADGDVRSPREQLQERAIALGRALLRREPHDGLVGQDLG
jgi:hypothetical protein